MSAVRFLTLNPGHFHAALVQKEMTPGIDPVVHVYGPLGADLAAHVTRLAGFNSRAKNPTCWEAEVHAGPNGLARLIRDKAGNVVVLAGRNASKIEAIEAAVAAGLHVLADKPWILVPEHLPRLQATLEKAERSGLVAYDIMTERHEITSLLQQTLVQDAAIFGEPLPGTKDEPGVYMESVHFLKKQVAGAPLRRPPWFFDVHEQGEGLSDVGTHLVDLVAWILFPEQAISLSDLSLVGARRWPTKLSLQDFQGITGETAFPEYLQPHLQQGNLDYFCNTQVNYTLRGIQVKMDVLWGLEAAPGTGDTHLAIFRGSRSRVEIRQGKEEKFIPELFVIANDTADRQRLKLDLEKSVARLQATYPGVQAVDHGERLQLAIPERYRVGHEAHFAQVTERFLKYVQGTEKLPAWERPNMAAKYWVTTEGGGLARRG